MIEVWKDVYYVDILTGKVYDYRGFYQVSNFGKVRSLDRTLEDGRKITGRILKGKIDRYGYSVVNLYKNGKGKYITVHRLVAYMFLENDDPINKFQINHKNEDKLCNFIDNLEWCTPQYNCNYGTHNKKLSETKYNKGSNGKNVISIDVNTKQIEKYVSCEQASVKNGIDATTIIRRCKGVDKVYRNKIWMYENEFDINIDVEELLRLHEEIIKEKKIRQYEKSGETLKGRKLSEETIKKIKLTRKKIKVIAISLNEIKVMIFDSLSKTKDFGFDTGAVWRCCNNKQKTHLGYEFYYLDEYGKGGNQNE